VERKLWKEVQQEVPPGKMLQPFVGMGNVSMKRHPKKAFFFVYFPNGQSGCTIYILLKKNRHRFRIPAYFAPSQTAKVKRQKSKTA
jgi:hypothetical protein